MKRFCSVCGKEVEAIEKGFVACSKKCLDKLYPKENICSCCGKSIKKKDIKVKNDHLICIWNKHKKLKERIEKSMPIDKQNALSELKSEKQRAKLTYKRDLKNADDDYKDYLKDADIAYKYELIDIENNKKLLKNIKIEMAKLFKKHEMELCAEEI